MKPGFLFMLPVFLFFCYAQSFSQVKADWPQFIGPEGNSTSPLNYLLRTWAPTALADGKLLIRNNVHRDESFPGNSILFHYCTNIFNSVC
ncbi:MAG TPA: hypothetical protein PKJ24_07100 [Prolixibacteraceae bacterium]|nr:hypothetical protein [Prolixibacteraceae bacterium]HPT30391.1 hypothetical protein [Prolixibacteraceae bacterium]